MARGKKFHFTYGTQNNEQHTVEIWVEGFAGTSEELQPAAMPVVVDYNKTVAESYMGGIVPAQITINVQSSSTFKASVFTSQNYGDVIIKHKTGSAVDFNCVLVPFVTRDIDLPDGAFGVELSCEFGLNYLKNVDYPTSTNRVKLATVLHTCISYVPVEDTFSYKILDGVLVASDSYGTDATRYFESYVSEENYADKTCYEVLDDICQGIREIFFSDGYWWVRNLAEINKGDSTIYNYSSAGAYVDSTAYARPTTEAGAGVRLKGAFGKEFSHKNVKITKPKSIPIVQFSEGEFDDLTDWTFEGLAALLFDTEDGKLTNLGNTIWNQTAETDPNYIVNTNPFTYQPFKNNYDLSDNEVLTLKLLAENGGQIKNLRLQIIAQQDDVYGHIYFLDSDGAWYRQDASTTQTPMYLVKNTNTEVKIEIPRPPYNSATFFTSYLLPIGVYEGLNYLIPPVGNVDYNIYIRIYLPERINDNSSGGADRFSLIDYVRFSIEKTGSEVFDGFSKDYGVTSPTDRTGKLDISFSTGFNAYPHGAETLFDASTGEKYLPYFKGVADILYNLVDDFVSRQYLDILSIRHKSWIGELYEKVDFDDLIEIDSVKYRVHNLKLDRWNKISKVTLVELASSTSSPDSYVIELPEDIKLQIEKIVKSNAEKLIFNNENFEISYGAGGLKELRLRANSVHDEFSSKLGLANLLKEGNESTTALNWTDIDGTVTDYIRPKADGFFYLKTEGNSEEQIATADTAWMLGATNVLTAASDIGSASGNYDINLKRAGTTIATLKSTGLAVTSLTSGYLPKAGTGGLLGNSLIYDSGTGLGIGNTNPLRTLHIGNGADNPSQSYQGLLVSYQNGLPVQIAVRESSTNVEGGMFAHTNGNFYLGSWTAHSLRLRTNNTDRIIVNSSGGVGIGTSTLTKKLTVNGDIQGTEITLTTGKALGYVAISDANGKVIWTDPSALNPWAGNWNASTNTPTLADGTGTYGEWYHVETAGSQDLGSGSITFAQGDRVIYDGSVWVKQTQNYTLNPATASVLGGIKIGSTLEIDSGTGVANQKSGVATAGTYKSVTVDTYGRVTAGTNPTTLAGYGITDAYTSTEGAALETILNSSALSTNYIAKWDGSKFVNSIVFDNGATVRVNGILSIDNRYEFKAYGQLAELSPTGGAYYYTVPEESLTPESQLIARDLVIARTAGNVIIGNGYQTNLLLNDKFNVTGNIQYTGLLKPSETAGADGQFLSTDGTNDGWVDLLSSHITDWSADLNIGGHITASGGISETLTLTEGSFERVLKGLYLSGGDTDTRETFFVGTDFNTGAGVFRLQYYNPSDVLSAVEMSFDLADAGRPIVYDPKDATEAIKHVMYQEDFATMLSDAGVSTGSTPTLQQVLDAGSGDTTKQISFNNSPYITRARFDELTANFGSAQGLKSVLSNGTLAENQEINFQQTSATGTGSGSGLVFLDENSVERGYLSYSNNVNALTLKTATGAGMTVRGESHLFLEGANVAISLDDDQIDINAPITYINQDMFFTNSSKGIHIKDTVTGTYYIIQVTNGLITATAT